MTNYELIHKEAGLLDFFRKARTFGAKKIDRDITHGTTEEAARALGYSPRAARALRVASFGEGIATNAALAAALGPAGPAALAGGRWTKGMVSQYLKDSSRGVPKWRAASESAFENTANEAINALGGPAAAGSNFLATGLWHKVAQRSKEFQKALGRPPVNSEDLMYFSQALSRSKKTGEDVGILYRQLMAQGKKGRKLKKH